MAFQNLVVDLVASDPEAAETTCFAAGALAVTLADAGDDPVLEPRPGETPLWPAIKLTALLPAGTAGDAIAAVIVAGLGLAADRFVLQRVEDRQWEREWLLDFRPMRFGQRLWICPGGQHANVPGAIELELDPGLAFGTGTHPTTAQCLEWLDAHPPAGSVLDFGCGSGVLALAALALGATSACAVDIDPQALLATRENALRNRLEQHLAVLPAADLPAASYYLVLANILSGPLIELAPTLAAHTARDGQILLAGLLATQAIDVAAAYRPWFDMREASSRDGWVVLAGQKRAG